jgi:hypothetical protein
MEWLNQNAGAVQAIMAIIIVLLTAALTGVTWWYASLTRRMASTMERQLGASFQPNIGMALTNRFQGEHRDRGGTESESVMGTITITNNGDLPLKVVAIAMKLLYDNDVFPAQMTKEDARQRVVSPGGATQFHLTLDVPLGSSRVGYEQIAQIHCSDLAGVSKHSFSVSSRVKDQVNQSIGFQPI